jgi:hypothetical protein
LAEANERLADALLKLEANAQLIQERDDEIARKEKEMSELRKKTHSRGESSSIN